MLTIKACTKHNWVSFLGSFIRTQVSPMCLFWTYRNRQTVKVGAHCYPSWHWGRRISCLIVYETMELKLGLWLYFCRNTNNSKVLCDSRASPLLFLSSFLSVNVKWQCKMVCFSKVQCLLFFSCVAAKRGCFSEMPVGWQWREEPVYFCLSGGGKQQIFPYVPTTQHLLCDFKMEEWSRAR